MGSDDASNGEVSPVGASRGTVKRRNIRLMCTRMCTRATRRLTGNLRISSCDVRGISSFTRHITWNAHLFASLSLARTFFLFNNAAIGSISSVEENYCALKLLLAAGRSREQ